MNTKLFQYCERGLDPTFWAEPINAVTNAAFWFAAIAAFMLWRRQPAGDRRVVDLMLIVLVFVIGTGSFLFHTFATRWAALADVIPIGILMLAYMGYALRRYFGWSWLYTAIGLAVFVFALQQAGTLRCDGGPCLNGSVGYVPAFIALVGIGAVLMVTAHPAGGALLAAGLIFGVSLAARTLDMEICTGTMLGAVGPVGTHFIWHALNGTLLYILLRAAIRHGDFEVRARTRGLAG